MNAADQARLAVLRASIEPREFHMLQALARCFNLAVYFEQLVADPDLKGLQRLAMSAAVTGAKRAGFAPSDFALLARAEHEDFSQAVAERRNEQA